MSWEGDRECFDENMIVESRDILESDGFGNWS